MKTKFFKTYNAIITALITILGFASSCDPTMEYGTPSAKFIVNGKVLSSETNQPIENIRVAMHGDTSYTGADGGYRVMDRWGFPMDQTYDIQFIDIDGVSNNEFSSLDTIVEFKDPKFTGGDGHWYDGETETEFDVKLKPKK